jgi:mRNA interferase RelE/StbE
MHKAELRRQPQGTLDKLPKSDFQSDIDSIKDLAQTPKPGGIEKAKSTGLWQIRQGYCRIAYTIDNSEHFVTIVLAELRREIYHSL